MQIVILSSNDLENKLIDRFHYYHIIEIYFIYHLIFDKNKTRLIYILSELLKNS